MSVGETDSSDAALRNLIDASLADVGNQPLHSLLDHVTAASCAIARCRRAAVGVLDVDGRVEHYSGAPDDEPGADWFEQVGAGATVAAVIADATTMRVTAETGAAVLCVPVVLRGRSAGALYLSGPTDRADFSDDDERVAALIATAAANFIEKTRTAAANRRRELWYTGAAALSKELVTGNHRSPLRLIAERLGDIADAELVSIVQRGPSDDTLVVSAAAGETAATWDGYILPAAGSAATKVMSSGEPMNITHIADTDLLPEQVRAALDVDAVALVPLTGTTDDRGVIALCRRTGRPVFSPAEVGMAMLFAGQVAVALELAETQAERDQLALVEERDRIARDLHDHVIQRLFAIGLTMQSAGMSVSGEGAERIRAGVDDIDDTIKQIRATIYRLTAPIASQHSSLRAQAKRLLDDLEPVLGFRPVLTIDGPIEFGVSEDVADDCIAVLREALTNVARHAQATSAEVVITVTSASVTLDVRDDGRGLGDGDRRSGLANMRTRAVRRQGTLAVHSGEPQGTRLVWSVPIEGSDTPSVTAS